MNIETFLDNQTCIDSMSFTVQNLLEYIQQMKGDNANAQNK